MHRIQISPSLQYTASNTEERKKKKHHGKQITQTVIKITVLVVGTGVGVQRGGEGEEVGK